MKTAAESQNNLHSVFKFNWKQQQKTTYTRSDVTLAVCQWFTHFTYLSCGSFQVEISVTTIWKCACHYWKQGKMRKVIRSHYHDCYILSNLAVTISFVIYSNLLILRIEIYYSIMNLKLDRIFALESWWPHIWCTINGFTTEKQAPQ